jgi:hypothetical protein
MTFYEVIKVITPPFYQLIQHPAPRFRACQNTTCVEAVEKCLDARRTKS